MPSGCYTVNWCYGILKYMDSAQCHVYSLWKQCSNNCWNDNNSLLACTAGSGLVPKPFTHRGQCPTENLFLYYHAVRGLEARMLTRQHQYRPLFMVPGTVQHETGIITVRHNPPCVTECDQISQAFALCICVYCKWSNTGGGNSLGMRLCWKLLYNSTSLPYRIQPRSIYRSRAILYHIKLRIGEILDLKSACCDNDLVSDMPVRALSLKVSGCHGFKSLLEAAMFAWMNTMYTIH